MTTVRTHLYKK